MCDEVDRREQAAYQVEEEDLCIEEQQKEETPKSWPFYPGEVLRGGLNLEEQGTDCFDVLPLKEVKAVLEDAADGTRWRRG